MFQVMGKIIVVVSPDGRICRLEADGKLTDIDVVGSTLPDGHQVHDAVAIANACVVLLDDGSVYHYTMQTRKWDRQIPPSASGKPGTILNIGGGKAMLLVQSDVDIWECNTSTGVWSKLKTGDVISVDGTAAGTANRAWEVVSKEPVYKFSVKTQQRQLSMTLQGGRLGIDRAERVALESGLLYIKTAAGVVRTFRTKQDRWMEDEAIGSDFSYEKPDPVIFEGEVFTVRTGADGSFPTVSGKMTIHLKLGQTVPQILLVSTARGIGFAHDVIRDVAIAGQRLQLATARGVVETSINGGSLKMESICENSCGLTDANLAKILSDQDKLLVESFSKKCFISSGMGQKWTPLERSQWEEALTKSSALTHYNMMLSHWHVRQGAAGAELDAIISANAIPVSLSQKGFGFDRPKAFVLENNGFRFYTPDGLVKVENADSGGAFDSLDPAYKPPFFAGFAEVLESTKGSGMDGIWLRRTTSPYEAWSFKKQKWSSISGEEYTKVNSRLKPYFWENKEIKWDRKEWVKLESKTPNSAGVSVYFDAASGRFDTDIAYDLAVFENNLWAVTKGGIIRFGANGKWDRLTRANSNELVPAEGWRLRIVPTDQKTKLVLWWSKGMMEWDGRQWGKPTNQTSVKEAIALLDSHLVYGDTWRIKKDQSRSYPATLQTRIVSGQPFVEIKLRDDGLFDFEYVNGILGRQNICHVASEFGLSLFNLGKFEITAMFRQKSPVISIGQLDEKIYARLKSGETLYYDQQWRQLAKGEDVFARIKRRVIKQSYWDLEQEGANLQIWLLPEQAGLWPGPDALPVNVKGGRFDFDTVYDIGYADFPWLITDKGLLPRVGPDFLQIGNPEKINAASDQSTLACLVYDDTQKLLLKTRNELYCFSDKAWRPIPPSRRKDIEKTLAIQVAKGSYFEVNRASTDKLEPYVRLRKSTGPYKHVEFNNEKGLFTFDIFRAACPYSGDANDMALIATEGGVALYDVRGGTDALCHLYCDVNSDGLAPSIPKMLAFDKKKNTNFVVCSRDVLYQLKGLIKAGGGPFDKWEPSDESGLAAFEYSRQVIADDVDGWQIKTRKRNAGFGITPSFNGFQTQWRGQAVRLIDLSESQDAPEPICRFAHDVPLSAALLNDSLWVGTRGGVVVFKMDRSTQIDSTKFDVRGEQTLPSDELTGGHVARGIGLVRAGSNGSIIYACREADNAVLCCDVESAGQEWRRLSENDSDFSLVITVATDPIWHWIKDSLKPVRLQPVSQRVHVPAAYRFLVNGTWAFLELDHMETCDPRHTIVSFRDKLYMGTAGGITRFTNAELLGDGPTANMGLSADVYAVAESRMGLVPMLDITELYIDLKQDNLYAQQRNGSRYAFDPDRDAWSLWEGTGNPLEGATLLVDNELFRWRMMNEGEFELKILPLDVAEQSDYQLFRNGRFAFDEVHEFACDGDKLWLAADGGVCMYEYPNFRPVRFFADDILNAMRQGNVAGRRILPAVNEIVCEPNKTSIVLCKTAAKDIYVFEGGAWKRGSDDGAFERVYSCQTDPLMRWFEYPQRCLEVRMKTITGPDVVLGTKGNRTKLNLFRHERFSFDDVREAVLHGPVLLTATPVGVVVQQVDWSKQQATLSGLYCYANNGAALQEMSDLEHIVNFIKGPILVWGNDAFKSVSLFGAGPVLQWQSYEHPAALFGPQMTIEDGAERWKVIACDSNEPMKIANLNTGISRSVASRFKCRDVSKAVADSRWIYLPVPEPKGGLLRIPKDKVAVK
jgi:hypothetical protein